MARAALADKQAAEAYAKEARAWRAAVREEFFDTFTPGKGSAEIDMVHFRFGLEPVDVSRSTFHTLGLRVGGAQTRTGPSAPPDQIPAPLY